MLIELAKMQSAEGELSFTGDLPGLLNDTVAALETLADELQEYSRLGRGRVTPDLEPTDLAGVLREAAEASALTVSLEAPASLLARVDPTRLRRALVQLIAAADYASAGSGHARVEARDAGGSARITIASGTPGGTPKALGADMGFGFFAGCQAVLAMGAELKFERSEEFLAIMLSFSLGTV